MPRSAKRRSDARLVLLLDAADRLGHAGPALDADAVSRVVAALGSFLPRHPPVVVQPGFEADVRRLGGLPAGRPGDVLAVVRPSVLLLPRALVRDALDALIAGAVDIGTLDGVPSDVLYVVSHRALTVLAAAGGVPGAVTVPHAAARLESAGVPLSRTLRIATAPDDVVAPLADLLPKVPPGLWRTQRLELLLAEPRDTRVPAALRRLEAQRDEARQALRHRAGQPTRTTTRTLVVVPSLYQSGAHAAWMELIGVLPPDEVAFVAGAPTVLRRRLEAGGYRVFAVDEGLAAGSAVDAAVLLDALAQTAPHVVHFDGAEGNAWAPVAFAQGARVVQHVRLTDVDRFKPAFAWADAVVGVSPHVCRDVAARVGPARRVEHIADGVRLDLRRPRDRVGTRGSGDALVRCLCAGRVEPAKGQLRVLDIVGALAALRRVHLRIVGPCGNEPAYCDEIRDRIAAAGDGLAEWLPPRYPIDDLQRDADVVFVGSRNEALGMVGIEALASGSLLVAQRSAGYEAIVDPARHEGLIFERDETAAQVAARVAEALERAAEYARHARRKAETCFDATTTAARLLELWRSLGART